MPRGVQLSNVTVHVVRQVLCRPRKAGGMIEVEARVHHLPTIPDAPSLVALVRFVPLGEPSIELAWLESVLLSRSDNMPQVFTRQIQVLLLVVKVSNPDFHSRSSDESVLEQLNFGETGLAPVGTEHVVEHLRVEAHDVLVDAKGNGAFYVFIRRQVRIVALISIVWDKSIQAVGVLNDSQGEVGIVGDLDSSVRDRPSLADNLVGHAERSAEQLERRSDIEEVGELLCHRALETVVGGQAKSEDGFVETRWSKRIR